MVYFCHLIFFVLLSIRDLRVSIEGKEILKGVSFDVEAGKIYALMGPNGSGKSTLANAVVGHPKYTVTGGDVVMDGQSILKLAAHERARKGIFLSFQYPREIPGVAMRNFLRMSYEAVTGKKVKVLEFQKILMEKVKALAMDKAFLERNVNEGFSGGEKKKAEILQAMILEPKVILLDEVDSGLDVDALKEVAEGVKRLAGPKTAVVLITHYMRILHYLEPDKVIVFRGGRIVKSGDRSLAEEIEKGGFKVYEEGTLKVIG